MRSPPPDVRLSADPDLGAPFSPEQASHERITDEMRLTLRRAEQAWQRQAAREQASLDRTGRITRFRLLLLAVAGLVFAFLMYRSATR